MPNKQKVEKEPWYTTDDDLPISVRYELEQTLGVQIMTRFDGNSTDPTYNHIVWEAPARAGEKPKKRAGRKKKIKRGPKPKPKQEHASDPIQHKSDKDHIGISKHNLETRKDSLEIAVRAQSNTVDNISEVIIISGDNMAHKPCLNSGYIEAISDDVADHNCDRGQAFAKQLGRGLVPAKNTADDNELSKYGYIDYDDIPTTSRGYTHASINALEKAFKCVRCEESFPHAWMVIQHLKMHEATDKPFKCPRSVCGKTFSNRSNLHTHQRTMSHHDWQFKCEECEKPFNKSVSLKRHRESACLKYKAFMTKKRMRKGNRRERLKTNTTTTKTPEFQTPEMELTGDIVDSPLSDSDGSDYIAKLNN